MASGQIYRHKHRSVPAKGSTTSKSRHTDPQGAYYVLLDISEFGFDSDLEFCEVLARDVGVGAVPGSSFFREPVNHLIRLHFAKKDDTLTEALDRLADLRKRSPRESEPSCALSKAKRAHLGDALFLNSFPGIICAPACIPRQKVFDGDFFHHGVLGGAIQ